VLYRITLYVLNRAVTALLGYHIKPNRAVSRPNSNRAVFGYRAVKILVHYCTRQHLRIWQLRMSGWDLRKIKNLQVSICAGLEEEMIIRNWEVQGGRQVRIWLNTLHPL